ncbi:unnamed protein product [Caenorhabditis auriculariae]|uniref:L-aminoadipate-semialdehyde dehydrogenase-phosphopantetheinyl transferase n=1 Tax=Caenorhabditis auriculariae TaxID=2777116 RepID=A0A8S1HAU1_9PELO|nr:unnamed protein product [Caenorhabditis auriculariae]
MKSLRWAVSLSECASNKNFEELLRRSFLCVTEDDVAQQHEFHYRDDSLACLVGRLLARCAAATSLSLNWSQVGFGRTSRGKPFVASHPDGYHFNVSHQGDFVVLASSSCPVGVDVMKVDESRCSSASAQIQRLERQFTALELRTVRNPANNSLRWRAFYRIWCLKESVLKATGIGLATNLRDYEFVVDRQTHEPGCFITSTKFLMEKELQEDFIFEESFVDQHHCVAVATNGSVPPIGNEFQRISLDFLLKDAEFINISPDLNDMDELDSFLAKPNKHF